MKRSFVLLLLVAMPVFAAQPLRDALRVWSLGQGPFSSVTTVQLAVTGTAQQLASHPGKVVCLKVLDGGTRNVYFGPSGVATTTGQELIPGETACRAMDNSNRLFVIAAGTGSTIAYEIWN